ncbi:MAG TPA: glycosyltransferase family 2 protein [Candidatus Binatia bacterium]|nr:glycosyltransferase family 2 protein [Candidatus Binatia bacterium]
MDLSVVIPAYNEEGAIRSVVTSWDDELRALGVDYEIRVYDDGSRDGTGPALEALARERPRVVAIRQENRGHGPTILRGYREARGAWIFQVDGDDEMPASSFRTLWERREQADVVLGYRVERVSPAARRTITAVSRWTVRLLFGAGVRDVNTPYRLFRREALARLVAAVPGDTFAPNVILAGLAVRWGLRVVQLPVPHRGRRTGASSIMRFGMWMAAATAFAQTVRVALRARGAASR